MGTGQTVKECRDCKHKVSEQAYTCIAQIALYVDKGYGQVVRRIAEVLGGF